MSSTIEPEVRVGDRVQGKLSGRRGTVIEVDSEGDLEIKFDGGDTRLKHAEDFDVLAAPTSHVVENTATTVHVEPLGQKIREAKRRTEKRVARDGHAYSLAEFKQHYGLEQGEREWQTALEKQEWYDSQEQAKSVLPEKRLFRWKKQQQSEVEVEQQVMAIVNASSLIETKEPRCATWEVPMPTSCLDDAPVKSSCSTVAPTAQQRTPSSPVKALCVVDDGAPAIENDAASASHARSEASLRRELRKLKNSELRLRAEAIKDIEKHDLMQAEDAKDPGKAYINLIVNHTPRPPVRARKQRAPISAIAPRLPTNECSRNEDEIREMSKLVWNEFPTWLPIDLVSFESNLLALGIRNAMDLQRESRGDLQRLSDALVLLEATSTLNGTDGLDIAELRKQLDAQQSEEKELSIVPAKTEERLLCDLLWEACPTWKAFRLCQAHRKLVSVGIDSVESLRTPLRGGELNQKLQDSDFKAFSNDTIKALRRTLYFVSGAQRDASSTSGDKLEEWLQPDSLPRQKLRLTLWESRPTWTKKDIMKVEAKLAKVDVHNLPQLSRALDGDILNTRLIKAGEKPFNASTLSELRRRVWVPPRLPSSTSIRPSILTITEDCLVEESIMAIQEPMCPHWL